MAIAGAAQPLQQRTTRQSAGNACLDDLSGSKMGDQAPRKPYQLQIAVIPAAECPTPNPEALRCQIVKHPCPELIEPRYLLARPLSTQEVVKLPLAFRGRNVPVRRALLVATFRNLLKGS